MASKFLDQTFTLELVRFGSSDRFGPPLCYNEFKFAPSSALDYFISLFTIHYPLSFIHKMRHERNASSCPRFSLFPYISKLTTHIISLPLASKLQE